MIELSFRRRYSDFLLYSLFLAISFRVIDAWYSEFLTIGLYLFSVLSGFYFIFGILACFRSDIKYAVQREFYYKAVLSGQYYSRSFEDSYSRKCRKYLYSNYCTVNLRALPTMIHILFGIIPVPVLFVFILPLIEITRM